MAILYVLHKYIYQMNRTTSTWTNTVCSMNKHDPKSNQLL